MHFQRKVLQGGEMGQLRDPRGEGGGGGGATHLAHRAALKLFQRKAVYERIMRARCSGLWERPAGSARLDGGQRG